MRPQFREDKATEAACHLLSRGGGRMNYMKLIKLMYLADRKALLSHGRPITFDYYVSMKHGPVLSGVLDRINEGDPPSEESIWHRHIRRSARYAVEAKGECAVQSLSEAERTILDEVYADFGTIDRWKLVDRLHESLREWKDPGGSSAPIGYRDILLAGGKSELDADVIEAELEELALADRLFG